MAKRPIVLNKSQDDTHRISVPRPVISDRQYYIVSEITFWKCILCSENTFFAYTQIWDSWKCTP